MEHQPLRNEEHDPWQDARDAAPRDGPFLFVIDTAAYDERQVLRGR